MEQKEIDAMQERLIGLEKENKAMIEVLDKNNLISAPRILIGVPILAWTHEFAMSFLRLWTDLITYQAKGRRFHVAYDFMYRRPVHLAEEELAERAVNTGCTHLLLMDDDIYDTTAEDVLKLLDANKDVVGGVMHSGGFPYAVCAFRRFDPSKSVAEQPHLEESCRLYEVPVEQRVGIQQVDLVSFGFTMIKTSVFKQLPKPWFKCDAKTPTDSWFADSILNAKLEYYAHFGVLLNHRGVRFDNVQFWSQLGLHNAQMDQKSHVVMLTPEEMAMHEKMVQQRMKAAELDFKKNERGRIRFFQKDKGGGIATPVPEPGNGKPEEKNNA